MKKIVIGVAAMAAIGAFALESANTVGYTTRTVTQGDWALVGAQFETTASQSMDINSFIKGDFTPQDEIQDAPLIQVWDSSEGLVSYYYLTEDGTLDEEGWADSSTTLVDIEIPLGSAVWFRDNNEDCTITVAGQVGAVGASVDATAGGWNLLANPYPTAFELNGDKVDWSELVPKDEIQDAPLLQVWDSSEGLVSYYYLTEDGTLDEQGWADSSTNLTDVEIQPGEGFWLWPVDQDATITFVP